MERETKRYLNLTNGLEWFDRFPDARFIRISSTCIEHDDWFGVFMDLDHDLVFHLATGYTCIIYDCGSRRPVSKTISVGVPTIRDCLNAFWYDKPKSDVYPGLFEYQPGCDVDKVKRIKRKFAYYKRFLAGELDLRGESCATNHDGDRDYYCTIAERRRNEPSPIVTEFRGRGPVAHHPTGA